MQRYRACRQVFAAIAVGVAMVLILLGTASAHKLAVTAALDFSDSTPEDGDIVTITGTLAYTGGFSSANCNGSGCPHGAPASGTMVVGENLRIQILQSDISLGYDPTLGVACASQLDPLFTGDWVNVPPGVGESETTDESGQVSRAFDTTGLHGLTICFRAHHHPEGGTHGSEVAKSGEINLVIGYSSCEGVTLTNPKVSGGTTNANGSVSGPWKLSMDLTNCTGSTVAFKVQGGSTAWAPYSNSLYVTDGGASISDKKKNKVITWNVTLDDGDTETITFNVGTSSSTVPCGEVTDYLSGAWSAAYTDPNTGLPTKTDYTARATVTSNVCQ